MLENRDTMVTGGENMKGYQMKITLKETTPPIWRRIQIPAEYSFELLHDTIQILFGWQDYHNYDFVIAKKHMKVLDTSSLDQCYDDTNIVITCESNLKLYLEEGLCFTYTYDYDDDWIHAIIIEKEIEMMKNYPLLLEWKGDNLAEDCGDQDRYIRMKDTLKDLSHPDYDNIKEWYETQHVPFAEDYVRKQLAFVDSYAYEEPILLEHIRLRLNYTMAALHKQLLQYDVEGVCILIIEANKKRKVFSLCDMGAAFNIQIYDNETAFLQGVEYISDRMLFNVYANAYNLILYKDLSPVTPLFDEVKEAPFMLKKIRTGYLPFDICNDEAEEIISDCENVIAMLQESKHRHLVSILKDQKMVGTWSADGSMKLTYPNTKLYANIVTIHLTDTQRSTMFLTKKCDKNLRIDVLTKPSESYYINQEMDVFLVMEHDAFACCENLRRSSLTSFEKMNEEIVGIVYTFIERYGYMKSILVNNKNMYLMLEGLCEDLHIPLVLENFSTNEQILLENEIQEEDSEFLNRLANMNDMEFDTFMSQMSEDEIKDFDEFMHQLLSTYTDEEEPLDVHISKGKKHFDA